MSDYYKILGVTKDSNQIQIRKAFRKLALQYHPDKNKNSEESKQKFMEIVKAYEILSDEKARERYDSNTLNNKNIQKVNWTPPADFASFYSYENLKREYNETQISGGMWEISEKANAGLWKATFILLASLGLVSIFILLKIY
ncbi:MAG TPA: DnaJ domain-containing protein [Nitrososphaeraceae archaeon]|nr:DnaJ domain-containing protein [Nitrososphaeraceae archaeon]